MGWFGPDGDCGCCGPEGCSPIRCSDCPTTGGGLHLLGANVTVSGAPASITLDFGPGPGGSPAQRLITYDGLDAINGSYVVGKDGNCNEIPATKEFTLTTTYNDGTDTCVFEEVLGISISAGRLDIGNTVNSGMVQVSGPCDGNVPVWSIGLHAAPIVSFYFEPGNQFGGSGTFNWCDTAGNGSNPPFFPIGLPSATGCTTAVEFEGVPILGSQAPTIDYIDLRIRDYPNTITMDRIDNTVSPAKRYRTILTGLAQVNQTYRNEYDADTCSFTNAVYLFDVDEECIVYTYDGTANCSVPAGLSPSTLNTIQIRVTLVDEAVTIDIVGNTCTPTLSSATFDNGSECDHGTQFVEIPYQECVGLTLTDKTISARLTTTVALSTV